MYGFYHGSAFLGPTPPRSHHNRSVSHDLPSTLSDRASVAKAKSTNSLRTMANSANTSLPELDTSFQTIQDPRASNPDLSRTGSAISSIAEGSNEVEVLSNKLINAINHQQTLDDTLNAMRHELEAARTKTAELETKAKQFEERIARGELITKTDADKLNEKLNSELEDERRTKNQAQKEKSSMEAELENLTASLFDEANKMVASANIQREATEKKNQQLRDQIKDGEALIASQTEQLTELKILMQQIGDEHRKDVVDSPRSSLAPSSPIVGRDESQIARLLEAMNLSPVTPDHPHIAPSPATSLTHLVRPQCRTDIPAYDDFKNLLFTKPHPRSHTPSHAASRAGSGNYGALSGLGLGSTSHSNSSSPNLTSTQQSGPSKLAPSPGMPDNSSPTVDAKGPTPLKDTRFFKRIILEDVEPTLRLDLSPSLSWLQRRSILSAVSESSLMVEPIPEASQKLYGKYTPCSVCGENRREGQNPRTHAMRVREGEGASKWAVCTLCLEKVRAVGDLIGYIRMVRDGVVKIADLRDEEDAWEEIIRLRERLFWAKLAGGVVPAFLPSNKPSPMSTKPITPMETSDTNKENSSQGFATPQQSRRTSDEDIHEKEEGEDEAAARLEREASLQLQAGLNESLTTFENAREHALRLGNSPASPPETPGRKRESAGSASGFPKISIPKLPQLPQGFWEQQVNSLH